MRRVRHEAPLRLERPLQSVEQLVEGRAEFFQLVVRAVEGQAGLQVRRRDVLGGRAESAQRAKDLAGHDPPEKRGQATTMAPNATSE